MLFVEESSEAPEHDSALRSFLAASNRGFACLIESTVFCPEAFRYCESAAAPLRQMLEDDDICRVRRTRLALETGKALRLRVRALIKKLGYD